MICRTHKQHASHPPTLPSINHLAMQITRETLTKTRKTELQKICRDMGLNNVWVRKDALINMILEKSQPVTARLAAPASTPARTQHTDATPLQPRDTAASLPCSQALLPELADVQPTPDDSSHSQLTDTAPEPRPEDAAPQRLDNLEDPQPVCLDADQLPVYDNALPANHDAALPMHTNIEQHVTQDAGSPPLSPLSTPGPTHMSQVQDTEQPSIDVTQLPSTPISHCDNGDTNESTLQKMSKNIETIMLKLLTKDTEIDLLNTEVKTAYTVIQHLQQRINELELQMRKHDPQQLTEHVTTAKCLLLGDTNIRRVQRSDLQDNCSVKTVVRADMDLLRSWVKEKLKEIPNECVIYCGLYDILEGKLPENVLDCLGYLISDLKERKSDMKIIVCQIVPVPVALEIQGKISEYNGQLLKWGEANGVGIVKTTPDFMLGTGSVDELCFENEENEPIVLNRLGVIRLLNTIEKQCLEFHLSSDWKSIIRNSKIKFNHRNDKESSLHSRMPDTTNVKIQREMMLQSPRMLPPHLLDASPPHLASTP